MTPLMLFLSILMQSPGFYPPPEEAPAFKHWGDNAAQWTNVADENPKVMAIPSGIDLREHLNERGVCIRSDAACQVQITYEFTINAPEPEKATLAVVRYVIWSKAGSTQICAWVNVGMKNHRYFSLEGSREWRELDKSNPTGIAVRKMTNTILHQGMQAMATQEP